MTHQPTHPPAAGTGYLQSEAARLGVGTPPTAGAGGVVGEPMVTTGPAHSGNANIPSAVKTGFAQAPLSVLLTQFDQAPKRRQRELAEQLVRAGYLPPPNKGESMEDYLKRIPLATVRNAYLNLLEDTASRNTSGQPTLTPTALLEQNIEYGKDFFKSLEKGAGGAEDEEPFTGVKKHVSTSIDIYSPSEARGLIRNVLMRELGREPTEDEFADFRDALNEEQRENPITSIDRQRYVDGEGVSSRSVSRGGIDTDEYATQWAQSQPGWAEWQAVGLYFPTALSALGAGVGGV